MTDPDYDQIEQMIDGDPIELGRYARQLKADVATLLEGWDVHESLLAHYRSGSRRSAGKAIDAVSRVKALLPDIRSRA